MALIATPLVLGAIGAGVKVTAGSGAGGQSAGDPVMQAEEARDTRDSRTRYDGQTAVAAMLKDYSFAMFSRSFGWVKHGERVNCERTML